MTTTGTSRAPDASAPPEAPLIDNAAWARIAILAALFVAFHYDILRRIFHFASTEGDWSHAFLVPFFSLFFVYQRRDELRLMPIGPNWLGAPALMICMAGYAYALSIGCDMLKGYCMIASIAALTLLTAGWPALKLSLVPILYLAFAVKISPEIWEAIAWRLQLIAASASVLTLKVIGIDAEVTVTTIELWHGAEKLGSLNVAEACSGMRMLMTFTALGVAVAYLWERPLWTKIVMMLLTAPIAIAVNVGRVTLLGIIHLISPEYATGDFHIFMGMVMLGPALILFMLVGWLLGFFIGENEPEGGKPTKPREKTA